MIGALALSVAVLASVLAGVIWLARKAERDDFGPMGALRRQEAARVRAFELTLRVVQQRLRARQRA
jgi:hypothetical protein